MQPDIIPMQMHFEISKNLGAGILSDLEFGEPGTRYRAEDLEGQRWMFIQKI
jgi:PhnB protein